MSTSTIFCITLAAITSIAAQFFSGFSSLQSAAGTILRSVDTATTQLKSNVDNFAEFTEQTGRTYASAAEMKLRERLFNSSKTLIDDNNALFATGLITYELTVTIFAAVTNEEFIKKLTGNRKSLKGESMAKNHRKSTALLSRKTPPKEFDWRKIGGVTEAKFQGECGSCWSFAVTGAIEGHYFRKTGKLPNLSEQNLIDCGRKEFGLFGCDGGFQDYGFEFVIHQKGIAKLRYYPYLDRNDTCRYKEILKGAEINGFAVIAPRDEQKMKEVIATLGPMACSINALKSLLLYKRGIYADQECNKGDLNHSVLVVGYGTDKKESFWIVKNSWSGSWGEKGFFRLPMGKNFCGIAMECSYPLI